jgi:hypothetical protein
MARSLSLLLAAGAALAAPAFALDGFSDIPEDATRISIPGTKGLVWTWTQRTTPYYAVSFDGRTINTLHPTSYDVLLRFARFDPLKGEPAIPAGLRAPADAATAIVQFVTQPLPEFTQALADLGVSCEAPIGNHAFVVRFNAESEEARKNQFAAVHALPIVRWVGAVHGAYKLEEWILDGLASNTLPTQRYSILTLRPDDKAPLASRIRDLGGTIDWFVDDGSRFEATLTPAQVLAVASSDELLFMDRWFEPQSYMNIVREVEGANYVETVAGFNGSGVRAEVQDTGLLTTHTDWGLAPIIHGANSTDTSHGTSVYGIVFGNGRGNPMGKGMIPAAQGYISSFRTLPNRRQHISQLLLAPIQAVFQTNSWGSCCTTAYTTQCADMDDIIYNNDIVLLQAQANNGNQSSDVIAFSKNIVSVGGIQHRNTASFADDFHSGTSGSTGPAIDGRIKPDLSFWYDNIFTTANNGGYTSGFGGTSAATPTTAGHFGLFFQMWSQGIFGNPVSPGDTVFGNRPKSTTAKAMMINTAKPYAFTGQTADLRRVRQGFGLPDVKRLYDMRNHFFIVNETDALTNLQSKTYQIKVAAATPEFRATMVYIDRAGTPNSNRHRVNDLSIKVTSPTGVIYYGNNGLLDGNVSTPNGNPNTLDTVENVWVPTPSVGTWTVEVSAPEIVQDARAETPAVVDADFALVVSGVACKADFNLDGTADFFDYLAFVAALDAEEPAADFNGDSQTDFFDYLDFIQIFGEGC